MDCRGRKAARTLGRQGKGGGCGKGEMGEGDRGLRGGGLEGCTWEEGEGRGGGSGVKVLGTEAEETMGGEF